MEKYRVYVINMDLDSTITGSMTFDSREEFEHWLWFETCLCPNPEPGRSYPCVCHLEFEEAAPGYEGLPVDEIDPGEAWL